MTKTHVESAEIIASYYKSPSTEDYLRARLIPVGPKGEPIPYLGDLPRYRPLVIGLGRSEQLVVCYPKGSSGEEGFHQEASYYVGRMMAGDETVRFHGYILPEGEKRQKAQHIVTVYKMPPADLTTIGVIRETDVLRENNPETMGRVIPEKFMTDPIAQRLLRSLHADRLDIVYGRLSWDIYRLSALSRTAIREGD